MSDFQRQHPAAALANAFDIIRGNFITILLIIFIGGGGQEANLTLYWIVGTVIALLIWGVISWYRFHFRVEQGELQIAQGVIVRKKLYLTSDRIQVIDISAGVVQRMFGLVAVEVKTAGSSSKEAKINAISRHKAEELKALLRKKSAGESDVDTTEEEQIASNKIYSLDTKDLLVAASTSGRLGVALSVVGALFSQIEQIIPDEQLIQFVENNLPSTTSATMVIYSIVAIIVISWLFSFVSTIIKYYNFTVEVRENELLIARGLFERTQLTVPFNRIQAVQIQEGILRQPLGYAALVIESAGYGEEQSNSATLFPLIEKHRIFEFIDEVIPEFHTDIEKTATITRYGLRRYLLRMVWISLAIVAVSWSFIPNGIYSWIVFIPALMLGYQQYRDASVSRGDDTIIMTYRVLSKTTAIIKKYRMQACEIKQNPFQSRLGLSNFTMHVASGNQGRAFTIRELSWQEAANYRDWLSDGEVGTSEKKEAEAPELNNDRSPASSGDGLY